MKDLMSLCVRCPLTEPHIYHPALFTKDFFRPNIVRVRDLSRLFFSELSLHTLSPAPSPFSSYLDL